MYVHYLRVHSRYKGSHLAVVTFLCHCTVFRIPWSEVEGSVTGEAELHIGPGQIIRPRVAAISTGGAKREINASGA